MELSLLFAAPAAILQRGLKTFGSTQRFWVSSCLSLTFSSHFHPLHPFHLPKTWQWEGFYPAPYHTSAFLP